MKLGYTVHEVHAAGTVIAPRSVTEFDDKEFAELEAMEAVRAPTDDERAAYEHRAGIISAAAKSDAPKVSAKDAKAAAKAQADADAAAAAGAKDLDPEVVKSDASTSLAL